MRALIDDIRTLQMLGIKDDTTKIFRSAEEFLSNIPTEEILMLYLDHDLGEGMSGYSLITELVEHLGICPWSVIIVSSNPVGMENIGRCLIANGYIKLNNFTFRRGEK